MTYDEALSFILSKQRLGIKPGLLRIENALKLIDNPQNKIKVIHIAGTNGKGTVANLIAKNLQNNGHKVGLFTSPWVVDYREQIQINGNFISKEKFAFYVDEFKNCDLTEFELITVIMYKYFYDEKVDFAVVECGMGGKGDATNVVDKPELCVITSVSFDHTDFLGASLESISNEKAGIIKGNSTVVFYPNNKVVKTVFENVCKSTNSKLIEVSEGEDFKENNLNTAFKALELLGERHEINNVFLPARQEYVNENMMIDGAHNPEGAIALKDNLPNKKITAVIAMMRDKDVEEYLKILAPSFDKIIATIVPNNSRAMTAEDLAKIAKKYCLNVALCENPHRAVEIAKNDNNFILICGSFYLIRYLFNISK